jgi:hypothetical protein
VIELAGLREVLCLMIDRGQITHAQGVDLWEEERQRRIVERSDEDAKWEKVLTSNRSFHARENPA